MPRNLVQFELADGTPVIVEVEEPRIGRTVNQENINRWYQYRKPMASQPKRYATGESITG